MLPNLSTIFFLYFFQFIEFKHIYLGNKYSVQICARFNQEGVLN